MLRKISNACTKFMEKYLPDAFLFATILTIVVFIGAMIATGQGPLPIVKSWGNGFWSLLSFAMQMSLVVLLGCVMAKAAPFEKLVKWIAKKCKTPVRSVFVITLFSAVAFWINWGIALVLGAMLAREIAREVKGVDYRLLIAMSYSGICITQGGLGGSMTLQVAVAGGLKTIAPDIFGPEFVVTMGQTMGSAMNLVICAAFAIIFPIVAMKMQPKKIEDVFQVDPSVLEDAVVPEVKKDRKSMSLAEKMENSKIIWGITCLFGIVYIVWHFVTKGFDLNINITNFILLFVGIILHGNLIKYVRCIGASIHTVAGILLQFPFYAGIMGMMTAKNGEGLSLAIVLSNMFVSISNTTTYPFFTYLSAGILNFFIPSGGGQWAVQGPIMMRAGNELGVAPAKTILALSYGDAWTNLIQPFWALPTLAVAKLKAKDIMGYLVVALIVSFIITTAGLLLFSL